MNNHPVILFDGVCNLCNAAVRFMINHDPKGHFHFAPLQGDAGQLLLKKYQLQQNDFASFVLIDDNSAYTKSTAALKVLAKLPGWIRLFGGFIFVPKFIRDGIYSIIARNRYRWFGKQDSCMVPSAEILSRFLN